MRSDIVFDALQTKNRFELCHQAFKAIRLLHKNNTRIEDTANDVLMRIADTSQPEVLVKQTDAVTLSLEPSPASSEVV
jgi:hypothetical protein